MTTGSNLDVDASAEPLTSDTTTFINGVVVKAGPGNGSGIVYISTNPSVTAGTADATDGFPLSAGETVSFAVDRADKIYVIGSTTNLKVFYLGY